jgi:hypothetical protein
MKRLFEALYCHNNGLLPFLSKDGSILERKMQSPLDVIHPEAHEEKRSGSSCRREQHEWCRQATTSQGMMYPLARASLAVGNVAARAHVTLLSSFPAIKWPLYLRNHGICMTHLDGHSSRWPFCYRLFPKDPLGDWFQHNRERRLHDEDCTIPGSWSQAMVSRLSRGPFDSLHRPYVLLPEDDGVC